MMSKQGALMSFVRIPFVVCGIFAGCPSAFANGGLDQEITGLEAGEPAPFTGDLFPVGESIRWALEIEGCSRRAEIESNHQARTYAIQVKSIKEIAEVDVRAANQRATLLQAELDNALAWYRSPPFVAAVVAVATVTVLLLSTVLVDATGEVIDG